MNSVEITRYMYQKGYITKEAALRILKHRNELVKQATIDCANEIFGFRKQAAWPLGIFGKGEKKPPIRTDGAKRVKMLSSMKNILPLLGLASLIAMGSTIAKVGLGAISDVRTKGQIGDSYQRMFQEFPELEENKPQATKYFNMMARFAPVLATNPIVAGTWVKGTMDSNVVAPQSIQQLMAAQSEWEKIRSLKSPFAAFAQEFPSKSLLEKSIVSQDILGENV